MNELTSTPNSPRFFKNTNNSGTVVCLSDGLADQFASDENYIEIDREHHQLIQERARLKSRLQEIEALLIGKEWEDEEDDYNPYLLTGDDLTQYENFYFPR